MIIHVSLNGKAHGMRRNWTAVPSVGQIVIVDLDGKPRRAKVRQVIWGVTRESRGGGDCEVEVDCKIVAEGVGQ